MIDYSEKRDFPRMPVDTDVTLSDATGDKRETAQLADLSATGMRFRIARAVDEGERFIASIVPGKTITPPLQAQIVVRRCSENGNGYEVAAEIERIMEQRASA